MVSNVNEVLEVESQETELAPVHSKVIRRFVVVSWCGSEFIVGSYDTLPEAAEAFRYRSVEYHESPVILDTKKLDAAMVGREDVAIGNFETFSRLVARDELQSA